MPAAQEMCCGAREVALKLLPLYDFVPLILSQVLIESFVVLFLNILRNWTLKTAGRPQFRCEN